MHITNTLDKIARIARVAYEAGAFHLLLSFTFVQGLSYVSQLIVAILMMPAEFGIVRNVEAVLTVVVTVGSMGMPTLAVKTIAELQDRPSQGRVLRRLIGIAFTAALVIAAIASLARNVFVSQTASPYFVALVWSAILIAVSRTCINFFQGIKQFHRMSILSSVLSILSIAAILAGVYLAGLNGWLVGRYVGEILFLLGGLLAVRHVVWNRGSLPEKYSVKRLMVLGATVATSLLIRTLMDSIGVLALGAWGRNAEEVGLFGLSSLIVTMALVLPAILTNIAMPRLFERASQPYAMRSFYFRFLGIMLVLAILVALLLIIVSPLIPLIFGNSYAVSADLLRILALSVVARAITSAASLPPLAFDRPITSVIVNMGSLITCAIACAYAIPSFGAYGAAWCIVIVEVMSAMVYFSVSLRLVSSRQQGVAT